MSLRALITNDDGVSAEGLRVLTEVALAAGLEVTVAAPHEDRSGTAAMLSALESGGRLVYDRAEVAGCKAYGVHASPAMIAFAGVRGAFGEVPDVVLSGINHGANTGRAVIHSGTVGAALTGASHGVPGLAVSLAGAPVTHWDTARVVTARALDWFLQHRAGLVAVNVNVPDVAPDGLLGLRSADFAGFGSVQAEIGEFGEGFVTMAFTELGEEVAQDSDLGLLRKGWATLSSMRTPIVADLDLPAGLDQGLE
ncbi:5'/3'-nucleotidase SurE [Kineosporia sp. NBRC 101731]|uniref:5'/3'-nucleotidase SurE n=1 Tax=Kineosporia sp. NBRC 101731 TaxID=3032199 RepID=UPI0024A19BDC|nr:5'/3'-nucleotidase SurE [Kineosporia sp. NBRC 101731]GLY31345.1 5'/3'-nucleotidase SurE [Kineosporia sp. NBRC 101731]